MNFIFKKNDMVDTRSNIQLADLNSKPHEVKSLRDPIYRAIGVRFYNPPGSEHDKLLHLKHLQGSTHHQVQSHDKPEEKNEACTIKITKRIMTGTRQHLTLQ